MFFDYNGKRYALEFRRERGYVHVRNVADLQCRKAWPDTEARLCDVTGKRTPAKEWPVVATARVGCWRSNSGKHGDTFSIEGGRRAALKKLADSLSDRGLRGALLRAYYDRPRGQMDVASIRQQINRLEALLTKMSGVTHAE